MGPHGRRRGSTRRIKAGRRSCPLRAAGSPGNTTPLPPVNATRANGGHVGAWARDLPEAIGRLRSQGAHSDPVVVWNATGISRVIKLADVTTSLAVAFRPHSCDSDQVRMFAMMVKPNNAAAGA